MKAGGGALAIAAGIFLLWVITSGRTANLASAWQTLLHLQPSGAAPPVAPPTGGWAPDPGQYAPGAGAGGSWQSYIPSIPTQPGGAAPIYGGYA